MKILEINVTCGSGSTGRIASDIAKQLLKEGHDVVIAYGRDYVETGIKSVRIGNDLDVYEHVLISRMFDGAGFGSKRATEKFIKWIRNFKPDVIHLHNLHGYYINIDILFAYIKEEFKGKVIWTLHDCWTFTGHCANFMTDGCEQWISHCIQCSKSQSLSYPKCLLFGSAYNNFERKKVIFSGVPNLHIVTPSLWLKNLVKQSFLKYYNVTVINNGIDTGVFKNIKSSLRVKYDLSKYKIILGVASVWDANKGLDDFLKLADIVDKNVKIVLIGLNEKQLKILPKNIIGIKRTESVQELVEWYSVSDLFFNPTYEDNYPTVNLEAQSCGTPVVTYDTGGSVESVPKENIIKQGDYRSVLNYIYREDNKILKANFSEDEMIDQYMQIYESDYNKNSD